MSDLPTDCHIEFSVEDITGVWRWECFTCDIESQPFESLAVAELAAETHSSEGPTR